MDVIFSLVRLAARLGWLWLAAGALAAAQAAVPPTADPTACVMRDRAGLSAQMLLAAPQLFDCKTPQRSFGAGDFWVRVPLATPRISDAEPLLLRTTSVWQDSASVHFGYADGAIETRRYTSENSLAVLAIGSIFEVAVPPRAAPLTAIIIETHGSANVRGIVLGAELVSLSQSHTRNVALTAMFAALGGMVLALIVYNLALWAALRHRFQLFYCGMVAGVGLYSFSSSGAVMMLFDTLANNDRLRLNYLTLAMAGIFGLGFVRQFFEARVVGRWLGLMINAAMIWIAVSAAAFALFAPLEIEWLDRFYFGGFVAMMLMIIPLIFNAWRYKSEYFWLFTIAWIAPLFATGLRLASGFGYLPYNFWIDNSSLLALAIESLVSSVAITFRLRTLSRERDAARAEEIVAKRLAGTDSLTGLLNRRAFLDRAIGAREIVRLMLIDIDHFKSINDSIGHHKGDEVLRNVAALLREAAPARALVARLGGEEFAILLPATLIGECQPKRLLDRLRAYDMPRGITVTASIGYAEGTIAREDGWKRLYAQADGALYVAKNNGRDRACHPGELPRVA